jgi:hypothetical protein
MNEQQMVDSIGKMTSVEEVDKQIRLIHDMYLEVSHYVRSGMSDSRGLLNLSALSGQEELKAVANEMKPMTELQMMLDRLEEELRKRRSELKAL